MCIRDRAQPDSSQQAVAPFHQTRSSVNEADSISEDFDDTTSNKTYLILLSSLRSGNSDQTRIALASIFALPRDLESCKTPGCYAVPGESGYCVGCLNEQTGDSSLSALEFPAEDSASCGEVGKVPSSSHSEKVMSSSELSADEVEAGSESDEVTCADDTDSHQITGASSSSSRPARLESAAVWSENQCRGAYCRNAGLDQLRGLCKSCYRTLLNVNFKRHYGVSSDDTGAEVD